LRINHSSTKKRGRSYRKKVCWLEIAARAADEKKKRAMNADKAKTLPLDEILGRLGCQPVKKVSGREELWYKSPFREEEEASLHISRVHHPRLGPIWI
jgi:hypothetical protein